MKYIKIGLITALLAVMGTNFTPTASAQYYGRTPVLSVSGQSGSNYTFTISNADPYSRVILYARSQGGSLWSTSIDSIGQTDQSGYLSTSLNPGISGNAEFKVTANGIDSNVAQSGYGGCGYSGCGGCGSGCVGGITFSNANPTLNIGQSLSVTVSAPYLTSGVYYISSNSNSNVVTASMYSNTLNLFGQSNGSSTITVCQNSGSACGTLYVTVNGGACTYNCGYGFSLSQTSLNLNVGQSQIVTANNTYGSTLYVASNSNTNVASYVLSGNQITVYGNQTGSTTINVCAAGSGAACANLLVTVANNGCYGSYSYNCGSLTFSQNNVAMYIGQTSSVSVYNSNGLSLYISSNSNSGVASASISGSQINLYGLTNGSTNLLVCAGSSGQCGTLHVTVGGGSGSGNITFSQSNVSLTSGQSSSIDIYSTYSGNNFYVQGNSNQGAVTASVSGNALYITANTTGNATITICQNSNPTCGTVYVSVNGNGGGSGVWFSQNNVTLSGGQTQSLTINSYNYGSGYSISSNSNSSVVSANVVGNSLNLNGLQNGSSTITVCQQTSSASCGSVYVSVNGSGYGGSVSFSQSNLSISAGQSTAVTVYGNQPFYISSNSNSGAASAIISGNTLTVYGNNSGNSTIAVCQNSGISCGSIYITVNGYNGGTGGSLYFTSTTLPVMTLGQYYNYQLPVSGGNAPYTFVLTSGSLPTGLALSASGQIFGTIQSTAYSSFTVRVNDNYNRTATASFTINGTGGGVLGASTYPNGQLINEGGTVYIVYRGQKSAFASAGVFTSFGFKFSNVLNIGYSNLPNTGFVINNSFTSHPWGAWVQSGSTIYFVHQDGLIPVPSWDVFVNNRGASSFVVPANSYDFQKPMLSVMSANDARLY